MSTDNPRRDAGAICPFYEKSHKNVIRCECIIGGTARLWHVFETNEETEKHWEEYCATFRYRKCPYALMLIGLYEESDG